MTHKTRFDVIARDYEQALQTYPRCRHDQDWLLEQTVLQEANCLLEISGGTGFLTEKLLDSVQPETLMVHDVAVDALAINQEKFSSHPCVHYYIDSDMHFSELSDEYFDAAVGLGGFHHIEDQVLFMKSMQRKLKKGGVLYLGDFSDNSPVQAYMDQCVDQWTATGHRGLFASRSRLVNLGRFAQFDVTVVEEKRVPFYFADALAMGDFFRTVHGLNQEPEEAYRDLETYFEITPQEGKLIIWMDYCYAAYGKQ